MAHDAPSAQLLLDLQSSLTTSIQSNRPVLHHLTADSSWVLSLPVPHPLLTQSTTTTTPRNRFNILIDPWLSGSQVDFHPLFSIQTHATPSAIPSIGALEALLRETEILSAPLRLGKDRVRAWESEAHHVDSFVDAIVVSHEFTDHCHKQTLLQCWKGTPVYATTKAAKAIKAWNHFDKVVEVPEFSVRPQGGKGSAANGQAERRSDGRVEWREVCGRLGGLPDWIGVARLVEERRKDLIGTRLHSAIMIVFELDNGESGSKGAETVVYTPHGIPADSPVIDLLVPPQSRLSSPISFLALLHGLHEVYVGGPQINLGGFNGVELARKLGFRYWLRTHDELKDGRGFIGWILSRRTIGWREALGWVDPDNPAKGRSGNDDADGIEIDGTLDEKDAGQDKSEDQVNYIKVGNGECAVLL